MNLVQVNHQQQILLRQGRITYQQLEESVDIRSVAINTIINDHLKYIKLVIRWVPHILNEDQKLIRVEWCNFMLKKFDESKSKAVFNIITGDETYIYNFDLETRRQFTLWCSSKSLPSKKFRRARSVGISLNGRTDLHVFEGGSLTGQRYHDDILEKYVLSLVYLEGTDFVLMDDNVHSHRANLVNQYLQDTGIIKNGLASQRSPDFNLMNLPLGDKFPVFVPLPEALIRPRMFSKEKGL
ncbi:hypothetical protein LAZ67_8001071 [Cordylochernes scorpioides]|uniref:Tc1-like transposase DDE domain-containing protein n=1 Tax=Cordylochernes scorpioides TaxID=51811 RepID=A0ABY6KUY1_9ARAC|nr:hypothetical protein LAZ67_8001071 [Cordylochernes scorpioides]